jgi:hypothetical protein
MSLICIFVYCHLQLSSGATWKLWLNTLNIHSYIHATYLLSVSVLGIMIGFGEEMENKTYKVLPSVNFILNSK